MFDLRKPGIGVEFEGGICIQHQLVGLVAVAAVPNVLDADVESGVDVLDEAWLESVDFLSGGPIQLTAERESSTHFRNMPLRSK